MHLNAPTRSARRAARGCENGGPGISGAGVCADIQTRPDLRSGAGVSGDIQTRPDLGDGGSADIWTTVSAIAQELGSAGSPYSRCRRCPGSVMSDHRH
jgi:hypothetical protein